MLVKPAFRGRKHATTFQEASVVEVYQHRPPYTEALFDRLKALVDPDVDVMLDVGTGPGSIARPMATRVERVDAVDFSERMIEKARTLPGGDDARINWIVSEVETAPYSPPYGLITAGACLHWFDLNVVLPLFRRLLSLAGYLAIVERSFDLPVDDGALISHYSTNQDFEPWNMIDAIVEAGLFTIVGREEVSRIDWCPTVEEFLSCRHSQNGLSHDRMGAERAEAYDEEVRGLIERQAADGSLEMVDGRMQGVSRCTVVWGKPGGGD